MYIICKQRNIVLAKLFNVDIWYYLYIHMYNEFITGKNN